MPRDMLDKLLTCPLLSTTDARRFRQCRKLWRFMVLTIEISQLQYCCIMVDVPVVFVVQAPQLLSWWRQPRSHSCRSSSIPHFMAVAVRMWLFARLRAFFALRPLGRRVPGGGDTGSLLPGVLPPELGAFVMGHRQRSLINILSAPQPPQPPPPPPPPPPPHSVAILAQVAIPDQTPFYSSSDCGR